MMKADVRAWAGLYIYCLARVCIRSMKSHVYYFLFKQYHHGLARVSNGRVQ
jgi:hypothetical protein